jgi:hypothetical protein
LHLSRGRHRDGIQGTGGSDYDFRLKRFPTSIATQPGLALSEAAAQKGAEDLVAGYPGPMEFGAQQGDGLHWCGGCAHGSFSPSTNGGVFVHILAYIPQLRKW